MSRNGQLYVAGLRGWQTNGGRDGAFERVGDIGQPFETVTSISAFSISVFSVRRGLPEEAKRTVRSLTS